MVYDSPDFSGYLNFIRHSIVFLCCKRQGCIRRSKVLHQNNIICNKILNTFRNTYSNMSSYFIHNKLHLTYYHTWNFNLSNYPIKVATLCRNLFSKLNVTTHQCNLPSHFHKKLTNAMIEFPLKMISVQVECSLGIMLCPCGWICRKKGCFLQSPRTYFPNPLLL